MGIQLIYDTLIKGNPMRAHLEVDQEFDNSIEQVHFGHWLELWFETLDDLFTGEIQLLQCKRRARNMAHILFMRIFSLARIMLIL